MEDQTPKPPLNRQEQPRDAIHDEDEQRRVQQTSNDQEPHQVPDRRDPPDPALPARTWPHERQKPPTKFVGGFWYTYAL